MKNLKAHILFSLGFLLWACVSSGQEVVLNDTLVTRHKEKIICKVVRVSDTDIEYKKFKETDSPVYTINREKVREIRYGNGTVEAVMPDEMDMNKEAEIIDKRSVIKAPFFAPMNSHLTLTYERCLKMGVNVEASLTFINNSMFDIGWGGIFGNPLTQGGAISAGPKFLLGQDFYIKGMRYMHPLKGTYFKPELSYTSIAVRHVPVYSYGGYGGVGITGNRTVHIRSTAIFLNIGKQWILGNIFSCGISFGAGYAYIQNSGDDQEDRKYTYNLYDYFSIIQPLAVKSSVTIGYIFK
jgi:hypothetical protein